MGMIRMLANRTVLQIFVAMLLVVTIMVGSNYMVYRNSISEIYGKVNENNKLVVTNIVQSFDSFFKDINNLILAISLLPYEGEVSMVNTYLLQKNVSTLIPSTTKDYIEEVVVFFNGSNLAITTGGTINFDLLFRQKYKHLKYNAEYWKSHASSKHALQVFPEAYYEEGIGTSTQLRKKLLVVVGSNQLSSKNVMVLIDTEKLLNHVHQKTMMEDTTLSILDQDKNVIFSTERSEDLGNVLDALYLDIEQDSTLTRNDYEYSFYKSDYNDFTYIEKAPYKFLNLNSIARLNPLIMFISIGCAILLAAILSLYLYRPIRGLLTLLGAEQDRNGDIRHIHSGIMNLQEENDSLKTQMSFIESDIRRTIFMHAVDGYSHSQQFEARMQGYFVNFFRDRHFIMVSFHCQSQLETEDITMMRIDEMTEKLHKELQSQLGNVVVFHAGNLQFIALVSLPKISDRDRTLRKISEFIRDTGIEEWNHFRIIAVVSRAYASKTENCKLAYEDLRKGMLYRNMDDDGDLIDIDSIRFTWNIYFPLEKMDKLSNCLMNGNEIEGVSIVNDIIEENRKRNIHHHQFVYIAKGMFAMMVKHLERSKLSSKDIADMEMVFSRKVEDEFKYKETQDELVKMLRYITKTMEPVPKSKLNPVFIAQYIEMHYMENLYLDHLAEILDTSPKYLSNYFKKIFRVNYVEYLNNIRLTHAKQMLQNTNMSIAEIGLKTGYTHSSTFSSTFKKICGISPVEYRQKMKG